MKLLVTGGAGFIGSNFVRYWLREHPDDHVVNFDALTYAGNPDNLADIADHPHYTFIKGDITDPSAVAMAMRGVDIVVHFAAESHVDRSISDAAPFVRTNVLGTQVLLDAALAAQVKRFHHVSTDEVFGSLELGTGERFDEHSPYRPRSPYAASKAGSDHLVRAYHETYGLPITITNASNNYGPYHFPEKLIPLMIIRALRDEPLPIYGDGLNVRDWLHVADHCQAIDLVVQNGRVGETYCVGGDSESANIDVAKKILHILGKSESLISFVPDRLGHDRRYALDSSKLKSELGFKHHYDFETGLRETIAWYQQHESWWQPLIDKATLEKQTF